MDNENGNYASIDAQLKGLIAGRLEHMADEVDYYDHLKEGMAHLKERRGELWRALNEHAEDTRAFARALLTHQVPPVALIAQEPAEALPAPGSTGIKPPPPISNLREKTMRIAEMLAPVTVNGRPNNLARRVQQG
jgi:hypothetical protein